MRYTSKYIIILSSRNYKDITNSYEPARSYPTSTNLSARSPTSMNLPTCTSTCVNTTNYEPPRLHLSRVQVNYEPPHS